MFNKKITEEEIKELKQMIADYHEDEFALSDLFLFSEIKYDNKKYSKYSKYLTKNYEEIECGCSETHYKKKEA